MRPKISIIGAGMVGAQAACLATVKELSDILLIDVVEGMPQGKALDLSHAAPLLGADIRVVGSNDFAAIKGSAIVIVTAGVPRKPGMSREELLAINTKIVADICKHIAKHAPECVLIIVSNPLDAMVHVAKSVTRFPRERVIGAAGVLDAARFRSFVAEALQVSGEDIQAMVIGGHSDTTMMPLARYTTIAGIPLAELLPKAKIDSIVERTKQGGKEIVDLLKTGSAFYAPGTVIVEMAEAIIKDKKRVLPCSVFLNGEYGVTNLPIGVPVKLGARGMEQVIEIKLTPEEKALFQKSVEAVKRLTKEADALLARP